MGAEVRIRISKGNLTFVAPAKVMAERAERRIAVCAIGNVRAERAESSHRKREQQRTAIRLERTDYRADAKADSERRRRQGDAEEVDELREAVVGRGDTRTQYKLRDKIPFLAWSNVHIIFEHPSMELMLSGNVFM